MTITRSDCRYYINVIKDLAKNFDDKIEQQINDKAKSITASKLKELYKIECYLLGENDPVVDSILEKIEALSDVCECNNGD